MSASGETSLKQAVCKIQVFLSSARRHSALRHEWAGSDLVKAALGKTELNTGEFQLSFTLRRKSCWGGA